MLRGYPGLQPRDPGSVQLSLSDGKFKIPLPLRAGVTSTRRIAVYRFSKSDLKASPFSVNKDGYNVCPQDHNRIEHTWMYSGALTARTVRLLLFAHRRGAALRAVRKRGAEDVCWRRDR